MNANGLVQTAALLESGRAAVPSTSTSLEAALLAGDRTPTFFELLAPSSLPLPEAAIQLDEELSAAEPPDNKESDSARDGWLELLAHVTGSQPAQASPVSLAVNLKPIGVQQADISEAPAHPAGATIAAELRLQPVRDAAARDSAVLPSPASMPAAISALALPVLALPVLALPAVALPAAPLPAATLPAVAPPAATLPAAPLPATMPLEIALPEPSTGGLPRSVVTDGPLPSSPTVVSLLRDGVLLTEARSPQPPIPTAESRSSEPLVRPYEPSRVAPVAMRPDPVVLQASGVTGPPAVPAGGPINAPAKRLSPGQVASEPPKFVPVAPLSSAKPTARGESLPEVEPRSKAITQDTLKRELDLAATLIDSQIDEKQSTSLLATVTDRPTQNNLRHATVSLLHPVTSTQWADELASRVTLLVRSATQTATLSLNPEELGPVEVRISVRESDATVTFVAPHADARAALEQAMPRLREMLAAQGLALADSAVFADSQRQSGSQQTPQYTPSPTPTSLDQHARSERGVAETDSRDPLNRPLLDLYA